MEEDISLRVTNQASDDEPFVSQIYMLLHIYATFMPKLDTDDSHICRLAVEEQSGPSLIKSYKRLMCLRLQSFVCHKDSGDSAHTCL